MCGRDWSSDVCSSDLDFAGFCLSTQQHSLQCSFTFSLCEPLNLGAGCQDASVCQTDLVGGGSTQKNMTEIGDYNPAVNPLFKSINGELGTWIAS